MEIQWSLVLFTALTGMGGWLFLFVCLNAILGKHDKGELAGSIAALVLIVVGGLASVTHLSHPGRMLNALQHPTSGIFVEAVLVGLTAAAIIVFVIMAKRGMRGGALKGVAVIGMILGALLSFMAGQSYIMAAIPAWNTELLPLAYLGTAAAEGAAAYVAIIGMQKAAEEAVAFYGKLLLVAGVVALVTIVAYAAVSGQFTAAPMLAAVALGGIVPAALGYAAMTKPASATAIGGVAAVCALAGGIAFRVGMWVAGASLYNFFGML